MSNKLPTIKEIAKRLNISISSVSRALHDHHSIGLRTKIRVREVANELNYEPNMAAIYFKQGRTFTIGVILPNLSESFFSSAISGIEDYTTTKNYNLLFGQSHDEKEREISIADAMKNQRVDGILVSVSKNTDSYEHFEMLKKYNIPLVFFDRVPDMNDINYVDCNIENGMQQAVQYLVEKGHRHIALINGPKMLKASEERYQSFLTALKKNNVKVEKKYIVSTDLTAGETQLAMKQLISLKSRPTAIIAFNDYVALDAIQCAKKEKLRIDKDISFVSFANLPICSYMDNPPLASVEQFPYLQGQKAAEILFQIIDAKKNVSSLGNGAVMFTIEPKLEIH